jgi:hypothetical protein
MMMNRHQVLIPGLKTTALIALLAVFCIPAINVGAEAPTSKGEATYETFDSGTVQYPSRYRNPLDDKPMVPDDEESADADASSPDINLPTNVCPLEADRDKFRAVNRYLRSQVISGLDTSAARVVIYTREAALTQPVYIGGTIILKGTVYNAETKRWEADVFIGPQYRCGSRVWRVKRDDSLTESVSVLCIGPDIVVLLVDGALAYLRPADQPTVEFRLVWDTGIDVEFENQVEPKRLDTQRSKSPSKRITKKRRSRSSRR